MNHSWSWALLLIAVLCSLTIQCSIEKPVAPTWNLKLSLPLVNKYYDMATLIDKMDEPYLKTDSLGNPFFCFEENLDTIRLFGKLHCDSKSVCFKDTLGVVNVDVSESRQIMLYIADFYDGQPGEVPPCSTTIREDFEDFSGFSQVHVQKAFAGLTVTNHLGLDLNTVWLRIIDRGSQDTLHTVMLPEGIDDGDSLNQDVIMDDVIFSNQLSIQITATSLGGYLETLQDRFLLMDFTLDSMKVIQGQTKVPALELSRTETVILPTNSLIDSAGISSGSLTLRLHNFTHLGADLYVYLPELKKDGQLLSTVYNVPASGSYEVSLPLDDYSLTPSDGTDITICTRVCSPASGMSLVNFGSSDSVTVETVFSEITFSQVAGVVESTRVEMEPIVRELDIPQGFNSAQLVNASLNLIIHNGVDLPADLSVDIQGDGGQNLNLLAEVEAGGPFETAVTSVWEDDLGSFLSPVPDRITVTGEITYGDGQTYGIVRENDFVFGVIKVSSPLELIWDSCRIEINKSSDQVDDDVKEMIQDQLNSGKLVLKVESHLPLGAQARIYFSGDEGELLSSPDLLIGPVTVPAGQLDYDGSVRESSFGEIEIDVSHDDLQVFTNAPFYMAGSIDFMGTDGQSIKASATDFIKITSYLELNVKNKKD